MPKTLSPGQKVQKLLRQVAAFSTMSAAFSPIMIDGALVLPDVSVGMIEASAIGRPSERRDPPQARSTRPRRQATRHRTEPSWRRRIVWASTSQASAETAPAVFAACTIDRIGKGIRDVPRGALLASKSGRAAVGDRLRCQQIAYGGRGREQSRVAACEPHDLHP